MHRLIFVAAMVATLPVQAAQTQTKAGIDTVILSANDPKFDSPRCRAVREHARKVAEREGPERFFIQTAWFLTIGSTAMDGFYDPTPEQQAINRDLQRHCVSHAHRQ